ncbi:TetR/AcrR family transcriptional regulator (plasmid) [Streptomyces sp. BI20]|uniref:TetR/AcrR family transcriptional regulator n=1 Tax=Streptomyces sp. BI20 TaxID=3403460 RepID=UPI003C75B522
MTRKSEATRAQLLRTAADEFARHGIAGARVDRIAESAGKNKNLLYVYFGNKEQLFDAVFEQAVREIVESTPITANDLPGYAGALFDFHVAHPHLMRLARWHSLERGGRTPDLPAVAAANAAKLAALTAARAPRQDDPGLPPELLLALIVSIATTWTEGAPEPLDPADPAAVAAKRRAVVAAVTRLTADDH